MKIKQINIYIQLVMIAYLLMACKRNMTVQQETNSLTPKIKTIIESVHDPIKNSGALEHAPEVAENSITTRTSFNQKGQLVSVYKYNSRGNLESREVFHYDEKGNIIETLQYELKNLKKRKINSYDAKNQLIESKSYNAEGKNIEKLTVQFINDIKTIITYEWINGSFQKTSTQSFNSLKQNIENLNFERSALIRKEANHFDQEGNLIVAIESYPFRKEETIVHYKYDSSQNRIESITLNSSKVIEAKQINTYNEKRLIVDQFTYGLLGNLKEHLKHVYEYDKVGNWTKDVTFINKKPVLIKIRKIEYYWKRNNNL